MSRILNKAIYLVLLVLIVVPLYPKFPLVGIGGSFVSIRLEDIIVAVVLALAALVYLREKLPVPLVGRSIILYWVIGFVSLFCGIVVTKTVSLNLGLLHWARRIEYMSMFFVGFWFLKTKEQLDLVIKVFLLVSAVVGLYGLGQQYLDFVVISTTNSEFSKGIALTLGEGARINSTFGGHYDLAAFTLFPLFLVLGLLAGESKHKWSLLIVGAIVYYVMMLTASRVTFIAFFAIAPVMLWIMKKRLWIVPLVVIGVVSLVTSPLLLGRYRSFFLNHLSLTPTVYAAVDDEIPDAMKPTEKAEDRSFSIRNVVSWPKAFRALHKNPLLGTGYSSVGLAIDGDYFRSLAEVGILGTLAFAGVFYRILKFYPKFILNFKNDTVSVFILSTGCALMGLMLNAVFIDIFEASKIAIVAWMIFGLSEKAKTFI